MEGITKSKKLTYRQKGEYLGFQGQKGKIGYAVN